VLLTGIAHGKWRPDFNHNYTSKVIAFVGKDSRNMLQIGGFSIASFLPGSPVADHTVEFSGNLLGGGQHRQGNV
jgi:hypothetical protein